MRHVYEHRTACRLKPCLKTILTLVHVLHLSLGFPFVKFTRHCGAYCPSYVIEPLSGICYLEVPFKDNWHNWYPVHNQYYLYSGYTTKQLHTNQNVELKPYWPNTFGIEAHIGTWNGHTWSSSKAECPLFACSTKGTADKVSGVFTRAQCSAASSPIPHASLTTPQPVWGQGLWGWWAWADTFLLTITSHGPTYRFPGPLLPPYSFPQASHQWLHQTNTLPPQHPHTYMPCKHVHIHVQSP